MDFLWPAPGLIAIFIGLADIALPLLAGTLLTLGGLWLLAQSKKYCRIGEIIIVAPGAAAANWAARRNQVQTSPARLAAAISYFLAIVANLVITLTMMGPLTDARHI